MAAQSQVTDLYYEVFSKQIPNSVKEIVQPKQMSFSHFHVFRDEFSFAFSSYIISYMTIKVNDIFIFASTIPLTLYFGDASAFARISVIKCFHKHPVELSLNLKAYQICQS